MKKVLIFLFFLVSTNAWSQNFDLNSSSPDVLAEQVIKYVSENNSRPSRPLSTDVISEIERQYKDPKFGQFIETLSDMASKEIVRTISDVESTGRFDTSAKNKIQNLYYLILDIGTTRNAMMLAALPMTIVRNSHIFKDSYGEFLRNFSTLPTALNARLYESPLVRRVENQRSLELEKEYKQREAQKNRQLEPANVKGRKADDQSAKKPKTSAPSTNDFEIANEILAELNPTNLSQMAFQKKKSNRSIEMNLEVSVQVLKSLIFLETPHSIMLGEAGTGKSTIVENLPYLLAQEQDSKVPKWLKELVIDFQFINIEPKTLGNILEKDPGYLKDIVSELEEQNKKIVLFIDEFHTLPEETMEQIKPFLTLNQSHIRILAATTPSEYGLMSKHNEAFQRRFTEVSVFEISDADLIKYIQSEALEKYSKDRKIKFSFDNSDLLLLINKARLVHRKQSKIQAVNTILDHITVYAKELGVHVVDRKILVSYIEKATRLPSDPLDTKRIDKFLAELNLKINQKIANQERLVKQIGEQVRNLLSSLTPKPRNILIVGKSGLGKTLVGQEVGKILYGTEKSVLEINGPQFSGESAIWTLLGPAPGYQDSDKTAGILPEFLDSDSRGARGGVVIVNEFEKMSPSVQNLFLEWLDKGKIVGNDGKTRTLGNHLFIFTSNALEQDMFPKDIENKSLKEIGEYLKQFTETKIKSLLTKKTSHGKDQGFPPELLGRMDLTTYADPMVSDLAKKYIDDRIESFAKDLRNKKIEFSVAPEVVKQLNQVLFDFDRGYRPIEKQVAGLLKAIQDEIQDDANLKGRIRLELSSTGTGLQLRVESNSKKDKALLRSVNYAIESPSKPDERFLRQLIYHELGHLYANVSSATHMSANRVLVDIDSGGQVKSVLAKFNANPSRSKFQTESEVIFDIARLLGGQAALRIADMPGSSNSPQVQIDISTALNQYVSGIDLGYVETDINGKRNYSTEQLRILAEKKHQIYNEAWKLALTLVNSNWKSLLADTQTLLKNHRLSEENVKAIEQLTEKSAKLLNQDYANVSGKGKTRPSNGALMCRSLFSR